MQWCCLAHNNEWSNQKGDTLSIVLSYNVTDGGEKQGWLIFSVEVAQCHLYSSSINSVVLQYNLQYNQVLSNRIGASFLFITEYIAPLI